MARLRGQSVRLLSYEEVRKSLGAMESSGRYLEDIPLDAIIGSEGRYSDFTRSFLPRQDQARERWAKVKSAVTSMAGLPPIDVYQIGDAYFVRDGNHRVSVARDLGATHIQAYVTLVRSKVPLSPDTEPDDLIVKSEYAEFLGRTGMADLRPHADLSVTLPGQYAILERHIEVHRYFMGLEQQREIAYEEAAAHWYDAVYNPVVRVVRERGILRDFPGRTETDLYLWIAEHRAALEQELGWEIRAEAAAADLPARFGSRPPRVAQRVRDRVLDLMTPDALEAGPEPGLWRRERVEPRRQDCLFQDILVAVNGEESGWHALVQALEIARREGAHLHGLHVVASERHEESMEVRGTIEEFARRCEEAGVPGRLAVEVGDVPRLICQRAGWADLVVLSLSCPPAPSLMARLGSGMSTAIRRCSRPILVVPLSSSHLGRALLAYDGSPKAEEALFVATYVAGRWQVPLVVVTVAEDALAAQPLERARDYLVEHGVLATYEQMSGPVAEAILRTADEHRSDLLIMGGYGRSPVAEVVLGSTVDRVLRTGHRPMLICR
jgi:nucleotide-binding universal stress UspA family protein